ncbi:class I SAM-dependent methyltransferase [Bacillus sp. FJAT-42315]|uniref:class I SAM-dependent methyltransferase n=1 Tax=Bacillus sp. FJAT-42315 TaxID=2014077 RepID=UPI000C24E8F1|nr:class I SAM-dependent methyltransferase [Bacillus sp. FJAT-42315]
MSEFNNLNWNHSDVYTYQEKITLKIPSYELLYDMMERLLAVQFTNQQASVLVVGAGGGQELVTLGERHPDWAFTGVDPSAKMLDVAQKRVNLSGMELQVELVEGEVDQLDQCYTAATCMLVLHFLDMEKKRLLLKDIADRLEVGAPFFIASINGDSRSQAFEWQMQAWKRHMLANGIPEQEWERFAASMGETTHPIPSSEMEDLIDGAGFMNVTRFFSAYLIDGWFAIKGGDNDKR